MKTLTGTAGLVGLGRLMLDKMQMRGPKYAPWDNTELGNNLIKDNFWGYNLSGTKGENNIQAAKLDKMMDAQNAEWRRQGSDIRALGHTYKVNNKARDVQFPGIGQLSGYWAPNPSTRDHNNLYNFDRITLADINARQESDSHHFKKAPLPAVRSQISPSPAGFGYNYEGDGTIFISPYAPLGVYDHENGHHLSRFLHPGFSIGYNTGRNRLSSEQLANEYATKSNALLSRQYQTPQNQYDYILPRALGSHSQHEHVTPELRNEMLKNYRQGVLLDGTPSLMSNTYKQQLETNLNARGLMRLLGGNSNDVKFLTHGYPSQAFSDRR